MNKAVFWNSLLGYK